MRSLLIINELYQWIVIVVDYSMKLICTPTSRIVNMVRDAVILLFLLNLRRGLICLHQNASKLNLHISRLYPY